MAHTFEIEVDENYRILVVVQAIDWGWQYFPQERRAGKWEWLRDSDGSTACFRSRTACESFLEGEKVKREAC